MSCGTIARFTQIVSMVSMHMIYTVDSTGVVVVVLALPTRTRSQYTLLGVSRSLSCLLFLFLLLLFLYLLRMVSSADLVEPLNLGIIHRQSRVVLVVVLSVKHVA